MSIQAKTDIRNGKSLQIFLEDLGYRTWWDGNGIINVLPETPDRNKFVKSVLKEYTNTGWVPYHYALSPASKGKTFSGEKVSFIGKPTQCMEFRNMLGSFHVILFEGEDGNNYVWKSYTGNIPPPERRKISARPVCKLTKGNKILNLISYVRTYEIKED